MAEVCVLLSAALHGESNKLKALAVRVHTSIGPNVHFSCEEEAISRIVTPRHGKIQESSGGKIVMTDPMVHKLQAHVCVGKK